MSIVKLFFGITLITICFNGFTQYKKNAVVVEFFGKHSPPFGLSYQRYFLNEIYLGAGVSLPKRSYIIAERPSYAGEWFLGNWIPEGDWYIFNVPLYCGYSLGKRKNHLNSELGIVNRFYTHKKQVDHQSIPFISLGYEIQGNTFSFEIPFYLALAERSDGFRQLKLWIGIAVGGLF